MAERVEEDYRGVVDNWQTSVNFAQTELMEGEDLVINVYAAGDNADIFEYVDEGTDRRYAVMNPTFLPRTSPGSLISAGGGNRRVAYFDFNENNARARGIEARKFGEQIVDARESEFIHLLRRVIQ